MTSAPSTRSLILVNAATVALALGLDWPASALMWPYWIQSIVIGYFSRKRILALGRFSTSGFTMNDRPVSPTPATQRSVANFFALHYGFFHVGYFVFLVQQFAQLGPWDWVGLGALAISFAWNHRFSFEQNVEADRRGTPNIGTLMFLPYARILPMHLTIMLGSAFGGEGAGVVLIFGTLKTAADVLMHHVEHRVLQRGAATAAG
ncbi:MAG TPA: DUF6498-containing protein [Steroidobacteraceae bacterium]